MCSVCFLLSKFRPICYGQCSHDYFHFYTWCYWKSSLKEMCNDAQNGRETVKNPRFSRRGLRRLLASRMWGHVAWFLRNLLRLLSGQKSKPRAEETGSNLGASSPSISLCQRHFSPTSTCFSALKVEAEDSSERPVKITRLHGIMSQETVIFDVEYVPSVHPIRLQNYSRNFDWMCASALKVTRISFVWCNRQLEVRVKEQLNNPWDMKRTPFPQTAVNYDNVSCVHTACQDLFALPTPTS
jgi:hypothetical protein